MADVDTRPEVILARLDRIPVWPYPKSLFWIIGFGFFFAFFDVVTIGFALPVVTEQFGATSEVASWTVSGSLAGYIIGSLLVSRIGDRYGRKLSLIVSVTLFTVGSLMSATSTDIWWLIGWRVLSGMGIGAEIAATSTFLGELSPAPLRGRYSCLAIFSGFVGFAVVPFTALVLVPEFDWGWRALFVIGGLGGLVIGIMRHRLPPSAHWLIGKGRIDEADATVTDAEQLAERRLGHALPPVSEVPAGEPEKRGSVAELMRPPYVSRVTMFAAAWFFYYVGNYAWLTLAPTLLVKAGYSLTSSIEFMVVAGIGFVVGAGLAIWLSDRMERKMSTALIAFVWALALAAIALFPSNVTIAVAGFLASATIGLIIPILYTYTAENFPTRFRATGVSATDGCGHLGGALAPVIILPIGQAWGFSGAIYAMAFTGLIAAVILLAGRRTTGKPLLHISE